MKGSEEQATRAKILTVDDDSIINFLYEKHLSSQYEIFSATSGEEAIDTCQMVQPDLILLDVEMPGMNGYETCLKLREMTSAPIVFATAHTSLEEHLKAFDAGGDDLLTKPLVVEILLRKVALAIKQKHSQEKLNKEKDTLQSQAKDFLFSINSSKVLLHFACENLTCRSFEELVQNAVNAIQDFSLQGCISIRHGMRDINMTTHGEPTSLEISILDKSKSKGKVFQLNRNLVIHDEPVSLVISSMPEDEESAERIRDNMILLAETTKKFCENVEMRNTSMERAENMQIALFEATKGVEDIRGKQMQMLMDVRLLLQGLIEKVEQSYSILDTTQDQERMISGAMNDSVQLILQELTVGSQVSEQLAVVIKSLRGGDKQTEVDLF